MPSYRVCSILRVEIQISLRFVQSSRPFSSKSRSVSPPKFPVTNRDLGICRRHSENCPQNALCRTARLYKSCCFPDFTLRNRAMPLAMRPPTRGVLARSRRMHPHTGNALALAHTGRVLPRVTRLRTRSPCATPRRAGGFTRARDPRPRAMRLPAGGSLHEKSAPALEQTRFGFPLNRAHDAHSE